MGMILHCVERTIGLDLQLFVSHYCVQLRQCDITKRIYRRQRNYGRKNSFHGASGCCAGSSVPCYQRRRPSYSSYRSVIIFVCSLSRDLPESAVSRSNCHFIDYNYFINILHSPIVFVIEVLFQLNILDFTSFSFISISCYLTLIIYSYTQILLYRTYRFS